MIASADSSLEAADAERALQLLSQDQREVVVLRIWAEMNFAQISELLGVPPSSIYDRYRAALKLMKSILEPEPCESFNK